MQKQKSGEGVGVGWVDGWMDGCEPRSEVIVKMPKKSGGSGRGGVGEGGGVR